MTRPAPTRPDMVWPAWLAAVIGSFAALEAAALARREFPPLSEALARWAGVHPRAPWRYRVAPLAWCAFWTWLTVHVLRYATADQRRADRRAAYEASGWAYPRTWERGTR